MKFGNSVEIHFSIFKWVINWTSRKFPRLKKDKMIILIRTFDQSTLFCQFQTEVHDVCHCLRTSYDKLSQVLLVRTIQLPNSLMAVSSSDIATESGLSPSSTGQLLKGPSTYVLLSRFHYSRSNATQGWVSWPLGCYSNYCQHEVTYNNNPGVSSRNLA